MRSTPGIFRSLRREHGFEDLRVEGRLAADLAGVLYRCGPGLHESPDGIRYEHPFDGDGAVTAIRIGSGRASAAIRVVASEGLRHERRIGRRRYGGYGTPSPRPIVDFLSFAKKNAANTSIMSWRGRLLALWEAGLPTEIEPETLRTLGTTTLAGTIPAVMSAHPHYVPQRRATYSFGVRYGIRCTLDVFELPDDGAARRTRTLSLPPMPLVHDVIPTERHLVFFVAPMRMKLLPLLLGTSPTDAFAWDPRASTRVFVVPLDPPSRCGNSRRNRSSCGTSPTPTSKAATSSSTSLATPTSPAPTGGCGSCSRAGQRKAEVIMHGPWCVVKR